MESSARQALMLLASRREALARHGIAATAREGNALLAASLSDGEQLELGEIDAAIGRILGGTWGSCEGCGGAIGRSRLVALPEVRHCEACAAER